jgi:hypothetical protein
LPQILLFFGADAMWAEGLRVSQDSRVEWHVESQKIEAHPIQQAPPDGRKNLTRFKTPRTRHKSYSPQTLPENADFKSAIKRSRSFLFIARLNAVRLRS